MSEKYLGEYFLIRIEDVVKRVHKTIATMKMLHNDIVGLIYDIKELLTHYRGKLIALFIGVAVAIFNHNRHNPGMIFLLKKGLL